MFFSVNTETLNLMREKRTSRDIPVTIFTDEIFNTFNDDDNRAAVAAVAVVKIPSLSLAVLAFWTKKNMADKLTKGLSLLR